jgi:hypothetical protein
VTVIGAVDEIVPPALAYNPNAASLVVVTVVDPANVTADGSQAFWMKDLPRLKTP